MQPDLFLSVRQRYGLIRIAPRDRRSRPLRPKFATEVFLQQVPFCIGIFSSHTSSPLTYDLLHNLIGRVKTHCQRGQASQPQIVPPYQWSRSVERDVG
jgi:hypothetical protein